MSRVLPILILALIGGSSVFAQTASPAPPILGKLVNVEGRRVHIYCTGQGSPPVVVASGGFSFDWGLVQPQIAQLTRICTYDPSGTAWSDPLPAPVAPNCANRVDELHELLINAGVQGPYVLVGFSIGGLEARLYAAQYPNEIAGLVLVDHAFIDTPASPEAHPPGPTSTGADRPPVLISQTPIKLDMEDDENFRKLPERNQQLHKWALEHSFRPGPEMAAVCFSEVDRAQSKVPFPLGTKPLAVVSTTYDSPRYAELQRELLALSRNSKQFVAGNSSHMVIIDEPETVTSAISSVVDSVRTPNTTAK